MACNPAKFLLVDDVQDNLTTLKAILNQEGVEFFAAQSGLEALELLLVHEFALAIIDVEMPIMGGFELAELMRGKDATRHVPIIFVTAADNDSRRRFRGYESGAVDFLYKPVEDTVLRSKADVFLDLYRQKQEIKSQRDALSARERELQSLSDNSPNIIVRFDRQLRHVFVNASIERYTGLPPSAFLMKTNRDLGMPEELCVLWEDAVRSVIETGKSAVIQFDFPTSERSVRLESQLVAERNAVGEVEYVLSVTRDISREWEAINELNRAKESAESANKAKDAFLAMMSHELRTPMTAILGYTDLVLQRVECPETAKYLHTVRRNGDYLLEILNDILDLSKIEAARLDIAQEKFSVVDLIQDIMRIMEIRAAEKGLQLRFRTSQPIPKFIESDSKRLKQILINLIGNAIKFTDIGSVELAVVYLESGKIQFDVIDTGIGISEDHIQNLFKPFTQVDATVGRRFGGTGLGLAISQRLATLLGGAIIATSELGRGSTFRLTVPAGRFDDSIDLVNPAPATIAAQEQAENLARVGLAISENAEPRLNCHVLVVDDRRDIRFLSKHLLTRAGATVVEADDGQLALDHVTEYLHKPACPDLILLDMQMPVLDGYTTATRLRQMGFTGPIIALTGNAMQEDRQRCIESGCTDYLSKPIDGALLLNLVRRLSRPSDPSRRPSPSKILD